MGVTISATDDRRSLSQPTESTWNLLLPGLSKEMAQTLLKFAITENLCAEGELIDPDEVVTFGLDRATVEWLLAAFSGGPSRVINYDNSGTEVVTAQEAKARVLGLVEDYEEFLEPSRRVRWDPPLGEFSDFDVSQWTDPPWRVNLRGLQKPSARRLLRFAKLSHMSFGGEVINPLYTLTIMHDRWTVGLLFSALSGAAIDVVGDDGRIRVFSPVEALRELGPVLDEYRQFLSRV